MVAARPKGRLVPATLLQLTIVVALVCGIFYQDAVVSRFVNSDTLLPAHMVWDIATHRYALANFEWPRIPSLPDIAFFMAMHVLGIGWRLAMVLYSVLATLAFVAAIRAILVRMGRNGPRGSGGTATAAAIVGIVLLSSLWLAVLLPENYASWLPHLYVLVCVSHGDGFIISLFALAAVLDVQEGRTSRSVRVQLLCALGAFCDSFFILYFLLPWTATLMADGRKVGKGAWPRIRLGFAESWRWWLAAFLGWSAHLILPRQDFGHMEIRPTWVNAANIAADLRAMPLVAVTLALLAFLMVRERKRADVDGPPSSAPDVPARIIRFGIFASIMGLTSLLLLHVDAASYRYVPTSLWWPLILVAGHFRVQDARRVAWLAGVQLLLLAVVVWPLRKPEFLTWRSPLELCLARLEGPLGLRAGLAPYWHSRLTMASRDWGIQVDQIGGNGKAYMWGNNLVSYQHDIANPSQRPFYNFLVVDDTLEMPAVMDIYGQPARRADCPGASIWVYDHALMPPGTNHRPPRFIRVGFF